MALPVLVPCPDCHGVGWVMDGGGRDAGARGWCKRCDGRGETLIQKRESS